MRVVHILPGVGEMFYCENCLRDQAMVQALIAMGHDTIVVPLYLPLPPLDPSARRAPLFLGGINVYLREKSAVWRRLPAWATRPLDSAALLRGAAKMAGMMEPEDLGESTLSMLRGEEGRQAREIERLVEWMAGGDRPDVVCLSDVLLAGLVRRLKAKLRVPVLCMLQDEDWFLDDLPPRQRGAAWQTLQERAADIDGFLAVSHYFKVLMQERLRLPPERVHVLHAGIPLAGYEAASVPPEPPAVGYLSRMCREKGLDLLVKSFVSLRNSGRIPNLKLRVAGGSTVQDADFVRTVRRRLAQAGLLNEAEFLPHLEREERIAFLRTLSVLSVPEKRPQAFGAYILEALACGVPVVQPRHGAFPELVEITRGGLLYEPDDLDGLTSALEGLFTDSGKARRIGEAGRSAVLRNFSAEAMARRFLRICETVT